MRKKEKSHRCMALNFTLQQFSFSPPQKIVQNVNETNILAYSMIKKEDDS
jgi:hypothetical protein